MPRCFLWIFQKIPRTDFLPNTCKQQFLIFNSSKFYKTDYAYLLQLDWLFLRDTEIRLNKEYWLIFAREDYCKVEIKVEF